MNKTKMSIVKETDDGLYVWEMDDGKWIGDGEGNFLLMPSKYGDVNKLKAFTKYAHELIKDMGQEPNGKAVFLPGHRQVSDEVYEQQRARQAAGLTPDPFDVGAAKDELRYNQRFNK